MIARRPEHELRAESREWLRRLRYIEGDRTVMTAQEAAYEACHVAYAAADRLAALLDRAEGEAGDNADAILSIAERITALADEAEALLGKPTP